jgi:apolipoprotein N-acyltransferase
VQRVDAPRGGARARPGRRRAAGDPSNDTWISDAKYTEQQLDIATVRAIEQRRWLVRASTAGPSALVDPYGRVTVRTPALERAVAAGDVWPRRGLTVYARAGDAFAFACVAAAALGVAAARRESHSRPRGA